MRNSALGYFEAMCRNHRAVGTVGNSGLWIRGRGGRK